MGDSLGRIGLSSLVDLRTKGVEYTFSIFSISPSHATQQPSFQGLLQKELKYMLIYSSPSIRHLLYTLFAFIGTGAEDGSIIYIFMTSQEQLRSTWLAGVLRYAVWR
jgi:NADH:ubiquinone oxidoreductase subunit 2 (subunit N)